MSQLFQSFPEGISFYIFSGNKWAMGEPMRLTGGQSDNFSGMVAPSKVESQEEIFVQVTP
jgi:hypothetical protein